MTQVKQIVINIRIVTGINSTIEYAITLVEK